MKKVLIVLMSLFMVGGIFAQTSEDYKAFIKERKAISKLSESERSAKVAKDIKKTVKQMEKEGWKVNMGALSLEKQLEKSQQMQYEFDMNTGMPKYIMGEGKVISSNYSAGKNQAMAQAKTELAGNIQTEVAALIEDKTGNNEIGQGEAVAFSESVQAAKQMIAQSIGRTIPVVECYRELKNGNVEVQVRIFYNIEMSLQAAKKAMKEELEKKGDKLADRLDKLLGL
ncbi:MAG: hypothetical protein IKO62_00280 [Bacteroidales bacterium]|nr:hypothetical protein [Bacteroidales bacterium]